LTILHCKFPVYIIEMQKDTLPWTITLIILKIIMFTNLCKVNLNLHPLLVKISSEKDELITQWKMLLKVNKVEIGYSPYSKHLSLYSTHIQSYLSFSRSNFNLHYYFSSCTNVFLTLDFHSTILSILPWSQNYVSVFSIVFVPSNFIFDRLKHHWCELTLAIMQKLVVLKSPWN
jgi:hypothetical protein